MTDHTTRFDQAQPSIARVYDYLIGGKDNYAADRELGDFFINELPGSQAIAFANRQALIRAVRAMAREGTHQFVDMGSGLPTADNVHQVAQRHHAAARVAYVDNDPIVLAHGRALLATDDRTTVIQADLRKPDDIYGNSDVTRLIDFKEPVGVIFSAILHHLNDNERPAELVRWWVDRIPSGSQVYISHFRCGETEKTQLAEQKLQASFGRGRWRTDEEIISLFGDLELLEPGLVNCPLWRAERAPAGDAVTAEAGQHELTVWEQMISCALARKP